MHRPRAREHRQADARTHDARITGSGAAVPPLPPPDPTPLREIRAAPRRPQLAPRANGKYFFFLPRLTAVLIPLYRSGYYAFDFRLLPPSYVCRTAGYRDTFAVSSRSRLTRTAGDMDLYK